MNEYIVTFDGLNNSPNEHGELIRCRDCGMYGLMHPYYCEIIDKYIPPYSFCSFATPAPKGANK